MQYGVIEKIQEDKNRGSTKANRHNETTKEKQEDGKSCPRADVLAHVYYRGDPRFLILRPKKV